MKILDNSISEDIQSGKLLRLDIGCGPCPEKGFYGVDFVELPGVAIYADLNEGLAPIPDNSVSDVVSSHCMEHISNFVPLMKHIHRIVVPNGTIRITVPHYSNPFGYSDPTHVRFFGLYTMLYFVPQDRQKLKRKVPAFYFDFNFDVKSVKIEFYRENVIDKIFANIMERFMNKNLDRLHSYERYLANIYPARQITYTMSPIK